MTLKEEMQTRIDAMSKDISTTIAKLPGLPATHHCPGFDSQESVADSLEMSMSNREHARRLLAQYKRAESLLIAYLA